MEEHVDRLFGTPASKGIYEGVVSVLSAPSEYTKVSSGNVLVVYSSSPAWTIALMSAGALISEVGGIICHTAIVSRELGVPCVVGVPGATRLLKDGDHVRVDGEKGEVYVLNRE